jgi:hypothetical protein
MRRFFLALALVGCGIACGAHSSRGPQVRSEFTLDDAKLFEDGVDLIETPEQLEGQWKLDWDRDLDRRINQSDTIALGTVSTLRTDTDLEHRTNYQIVMNVESTLEGDRPGSELTLTSREGASGYSSIEEHKDQLLSRKLVAFVKYAKNENGTVIWHFHLSAPSKAVLDRVAVFDAQKHSSQIQVIEHRE